MGGSLLFTAAWASRRRAPLNLQDGARQCCVGDVTVLGTSTVTPCQRATVCGRHLLTLRTSTSLATQAGQRMTASSRFRSAPLHGARQPVSRTDAGQLAMPPTHPVRTGNC